MDIISFFPGKLFQILFFSTEKIELFSDICLIWTLPIYKFNLPDPDTSNLLADIEWQ